MESVVDPAYLAKIIGSVFLAFVLFAIALVLIRKVKSKRVSDAVVRKRDSRFPFPQSCASQNGILHPTVADPTEREQTIRNLYGDWLSRYLLPTYDARGAFLRVGIERKRLRYQVTTTSMSQALGLMLSILMSGDDLSAPDRFERLLTFLIAYPSTQSEDLSSWYTLPDMTAPPRLEADPHAEAWIAYCLLMAKKQWTQGELFDYDHMLDYRLNALLALQKDIEPDDHKRAIHAPLFFEAFAAQKEGDPWRNISQATKDELMKHLHNAAFALDGSSEDAWLAFSGLHAGLAGILNPKEDTLKLTARFEGLVYDAIKRLPENMNAAEMDGLSPLALLACCAPLAMAQNDQELVNRYWKTLASTELQNRDAIGESLRLLALLALNGNMWNALA